MMKVQEIMKPVRWTVRSDDSLATAEWLMARRRLHHLLVVDGGRLEGILTDRDLLDSRAAAQSGPDAEPWWRVAVGRAMQEVPPTARPDDALTVATERLAESPVDVLPIVDRGFVLGQITATDVLEAERAPVDPPPPAMTAADVMTEPVVAVKPGDLLLDAAALMVDHDIRHLPVIDGEAVVGMLSDRDIRTLAGDPARLTEPAFNENLRTLTVRDAMVDDVITVAGDHPLQDVAHAFASERIGAIPVVAPGGKLIGIVSYLDALRALA
jgi:acetoin utilization protein AcuB